MGKLLFWVAAIIVVLFVIRLINHKKANKSRQSGTKHKGTPSLDKAEEMVRCEHCGVYMPRSEALLQDERFWCSQEHAKAGPRKR